MLFKALFAIFSMIIAGADFKTGVVPRLAFVIAFPLFIILKILSNESLPLWELFAGAVLGLGIFLIAFFISGRKLGLADVWYSALIGLVLGPLWWYLAIGSACITGMIFMLASRRRRIPFIPFMALGSIVVSVIQVAGTFSLR